jgi:hypothetical protein
MNRLFGYCGWSHQHSPLLLRVFDAPNRSPNVQLELPHCHIPAELRHHVVAGIKPGEITVEALDK